jgi:hypothetical protein
MNELVQMLRQLEQSRFYGSLEMKFESGQVVLLKKTETLKPTQQSYGDNRGTYERNQPR